MLKQLRRRIAQALYPELCAHKDAASAAPRPEPLLLEPGWRVGNAARPASPSCGVSTDDLVRLANAYGAAQGLSLSTVSTYAAKDGKFFARLEAGAGCTLRRADQLLRWFDAHWPADLEWPADVPRPALREAGR